MYLYSQHQAKLDQGRLQVAGLAVGALEALAQASGVVAQATAGAVTVLLAVGERGVVERGVLATRAHLRVRARRALLHGAVRATEAELALAAEDLVSIPARGVDGIRRGGGARAVADGISVVDSELALALAGAVAAAVVGAHSAVARAALVAGEALAQTSLAVADTLVGALLVQVSLVVHQVAGGVLGLRDHPPSAVKRARALAAVSASPRNNLLADVVGGAILADVARAAVVVGASAVATARVRAGSLNGQNASEEDDRNESGALHDNNKALKYD